MVKILITILLAGYFVFCFFGIFKTKVVLPRPKEFYDEHTNGFLGYKMELTTDQEALNFFRIVFTLFFFAGVVVAWSMGLFESNKPKETITQEQQQAQQQQAQRTEQTVKTNKGTTGGTD